MSLNVLGVIQRAFRICGGLASSTTGNPDDAAMGLIAFNAMKRAWMGTLIGPRLSSYAFTTTVGQAENGGEYTFPATAAFTLTAPNPRAGNRFGVVDANLIFNTFNLTVARNGALINGVASNYVISTAGGSTRFWYRPDTANWVLEADSPSLTSAIEFPDNVIAYMPYMLAVVMKDEFNADLAAETELAAAEGRAVLARMYGRRGRSQMDGPIGLAQPAQG